MTLNVLLDELHEAFAILAFFVFSDTLDVAELVERCGFDSGQRMEYFIAENDIGWESFLGSTFFSELSQGFE